MIPSEPEKRRGHWTKLTLSEAYPLICVKVYNVHDAPIIYYHSMNIVVGHFCCYYRCITVRMVHLSCICFCEDNVFKFLLGAFHWTFVNLMNLCEGSTSCFSCTSISCVPALPSYMWSSKDSQNFSYSLWASLLWSLICGSDLSFIL